MMKTVHGIIRGNTIEVTEDLGVPEGQSVEVQITIIEQPHVWGTGLNAIAGALAEDADWDGIMEEIHNKRQLERQDQVDE